MRWPGTDERILFACCGLAQASRRKDVWKPPVAERIATFLTLPEREDKNFITIALDAVRALI